ncbi:MAG: OmpA family protein [Ignavibacteriae bacterium]|nr:OmpA family protein [Ignavibacteriota bacterium]
MIQIPRYLVGLVGLSIIITLQLIIPTGFFKLLSFFIWVSSLALVINLMVLVINYFMGSDESDETDTNTLLHKILIASKIVIGFGLVLSAIVFCFDFIISKFSYYKHLDYKLFMPFGILFFIGRLFLNEKKVNTIIKDFIAKWTPKIKEVLGDLEVVGNKAWQWALGKKWLVGTIGLILLLLFTIPSLFKSPVQGPKLVNLIIHEADSLVINRDYDQRIKITVSNQDTIAKNVYLEVVQESGDSLMLGFVGSGSHYEEEFKTQAIYAHYDHTFDLLAHTAQAQQSKYDLKVLLYEADSLNTKGTRLLDEKTFMVNIHQGELNVEFTKIKSEPFSLAQTYQVKNNGALISDFSLIADTTFAKLIHMSPRIANYRFESGEALNVTIGPKLHVGFKEVSGSISGTSGMSADPKELVLVFKAPEEKSLFLAVSDCGSNSTTEICECTNQSRTQVRVSTPSENNGPIITVTGGGGGTGIEPPITQPEPPIPPDDTPPEEEEEPGEPPAEEPDFEPFNAEYDDKEAILAVAERFKNKFEEAKESFDDPGINGRLGEALRRIANIVTAVNLEEKLTESFVNKINEDFQFPDTVYKEIITNRGNNGARTRLANAAPSTDLNGHVNLRFGNKVASDNNSAVPAMYFSKQHIHFAWHEQSRYKDEGQRVYYTRHHTKGPVELTQKEMNKPSDSGRWPMTIEGKSGNMFYTWQGKMGASTYDVFIRTSNDNGETWSPEKNLSNHSKNVFAPRLSYYNDVLYVYWIDFDSQYSRLVVSYSTDQGKTFSKPAEISGVIRPYGVVKMVQHQGQVFFLYEVKYDDGKVYVVCQRVERAKILDGIGSNFQTALRRIGVGSQPTAVIDKNDNIHMAFEYKNNGKSQIKYVGIEASKALTGAPVEFKVKEFNGDESYRLSPSLVASNDKLSLLYHTGREHHGKLIDHLQIETFNFDTSSWGDEIHRLPTLTSNVERMFLSVHFKLPWSRSVYDAHDVKILLNGWQVGHLKNTIPEGKLLFPIDTRILNYDYKGGGDNLVTLETKHFNPAAYLAASEIKLISNLSFMEQFVFASSQKEADSLLYSRNAYNHVQPDLGFYSTIKTKIPKDVKDGDEIVLNLSVWNLGQGKSTESRIDIFGGAYNIRNENFEDRHLYGQQKLGTIHPFTKQEIEIPVTYWSGLEKVVIKITSKEKDFDLSNNTFTAVLTNPKDNLYVANNSTSMLRVAVYDSPGILAETVSFELIDPRNGVPLERSEKNPTFWRPNQGEYNVHIVSGKDKSSEQWISGIPITMNIDEFGNTIQNSNISLDIQLKKQDLMLKSLGAEKIGSNINFDLPSELLFEVNDSNINLYAIEYLRKVIYLMNTYPNSTLKIEGHTDGDGDEQSNMVLSLRRANTVATWLTTNGQINTSRISTVGLGETHPIAGNDTDDGKAKNRRVTFNLNLND